jgi:hypothetical protein
LVGEESLSLSGMFSLIILPRRVGTYTSLFATKKGKNNIFKYQDGNFLVNGNQKS